MALAADLSAAGVPFMPWELFLAWFRWEQGDHVSLIGPTKAGKTTLALELLPMRDYTVVFGTKPQDATLSVLLRRGWTRIQSWDDPRRPNMVADVETGKSPRQRLILWPKFERMSDRKAHPAIFRRAMDQMFAEHGWTLFADEVSYLVRRLGLREELEDWWQAGRSIGLTTMAATQRPAHVPLEMYSQATHLFLWSTNDGRDLKRLSDISGQSGKQLADVVQGLNFSAHEVLYVNTATGEMAITTPPPPPPTSGRRR